MSRRAVADIQEAKAELGRKHVEHWVTLGGMAESLEIFMQDPSSA